MRVTIWNGKIVCAIILSSNFFSLFLSFCQIFLRGFPFSISSFSYLLILSKSSSLSSIQFLFGYPIGLTPAARHRTSLPTISQVPGDKCTEYSLISFCSFLPGLYCWEEVVKAVVGSVFYRIRISNALSWYAPHQTCATIAISWLSLLVSDTNRVGFSISFSVICRRWAVF